MKFSVYFYGSSFAEIIIVGTANSRPSLCYLIKDDHIYANAYMQYDSARLPGGLTQYSNYVENATNATTTVMFQFKKACSYLYSSTLYDSITGAAQVSTTVNSASVGTTINPPLNYFNFYCIYK